MKVAWVTIYNAEDPSEYGGRGYGQPQSLKEQSIDIDYVGSLKTPSLYVPIIKAKYRFYQNKRRFITYDPLIESFVLKSYAQQISKRLSKLNSVDFVFSGICPYLQPVTYLDCKQPIITWTDTPLVSAFDFYPGMGRNEMAPEFLTIGVANDKEALNRASLVIYGSEWAAQIAISQYQINPSKVKVLPLGPNIPSNYGLQDIQSIIDSRPSDHCRLLFLGGDWKRKGGDTAIEVARELNHSGLRTTLTTVGYSPQFAEPLPDYINCLGYVSNATQEGIKKLQTLLAESHFLILPTFADACPHVVSEANSFGVPSLTSDVGGLPTLVQDDINGKKFFKNAKAEEYCNYISNLFSNYSRYKSLAKSSFYDYENRLSWSASGRIIKTLLADLTK